MATLLLGFAISLLGERADAAEPTDYSSLVSERYLAPGRVIATVQDTKVFTEGPAVDGQGNLLFTNVPMNKILRLDGKTHQLSVFRTNSNATNGLLFSRDGTLYACEGAKGRITRTDPKSGKISVVASRYRNFPFAATNDLCLDHQGNLYFTSRPSKTNNPEVENVNAVYRVTPQGQVKQVLAWPKVHMPNGIVIAPDGKRLYLIEAHPQANHHRDIRSYAINQDGSLNDEKVHFNFYPGRSGDGMCIDSRGNLYVAAGLHKTRGTSETLDTKPGIHVISPQGKLLAYQPTPVDTVTNCTFGGADLKTLYVTCGTKIVAFRTKIPGADWYRVHTRVR